ncbi:MAG: serine/threonine-protein kinase [Pseudomonadota bacterium]
MTALSDQPNKRDSSVPGWLQWSALGANRRKDALPNGFVLDERFTIRSFLGEGGFGYTYKATDTSGQVFVLKECYPKTLCRRNGLTVGLKAAAHEEQVQRIRRQFRQEAKALAVLDHGNIVDGGEVIEEHGTIYLVMSYVKGCQMGAMPRGLNRKATVTRAEKISLKLLSALEHVHNSGYLHNDISPENIILEGKRNPLLIDFGTCSKIDSTQSAELADDLIVVKPGYSPPEFYCSEFQKTRQSDIYQLGATLYKAVTREQPMEAMQRLSEFARKGRDRMQTALELHQPLNPRFFDAIAKATSYDVSQRFETVTEWKSYLDG